MKIIKLISIVLCLHLWYSNADLLIASKQIAQELEVEIIDKIMLSLFALSYSLISAVSVFKLKKFFPIIVFAMLDGIAVYLRINIAVPCYMQVSSVFYGIYTCFLIIVCYLLNKQEQKQNEQKQEQKQEEEQNQEQKQNQEQNQEQKQMFDLVRLKRRLNPAKKEKRIEIIDSIQDEDLKQELAKIYL